MKKYLQNIVTGLVSLIKGMIVTLKYYFIKPITVQYPHERIAVSPRWRGILRQIRDSNGEEICDGCGICARNCPTSCISMEVYKDEKTGKRKTSFYVINFGRCMFCGLCVESCPKKCLIHTPDYEFVSYNRDGLILGKDKILR
jgi:NADH-quinone oxidoreductase chain I